jgi:hypothetical protein
VPSSFSTTSSAAGALILTISDEDVTSGCSVTSEGANASSLIAIGLTGQIPDAQKPLTAVAKYAFFEYASPKSCHFILSDAAPWICSHPCVNALIV